jgi:hypothetical protein
MSVAVVTHDAPLTSGAPDTLFQTRVVSPAGNQQRYDGARDGPFLINPESQNMTSEAIHLLLNRKPPAN